MKLLGKIIHYSSEEGNGIILTKERQKFVFTIEEWDDYDVMPSMGCEVAFTAQGQQAFGIVAALKEERSEESQLRRSIAKDAELAGSPGLEGAELPGAALQIRLSVDVERAIREYFLGIEDDIDQRSQYKNAKGQLDFLQIRRFLFTIYNNLSELDVHFITQEIREMRDDLVEMSRVFDDYKIKTSYPDVAFDKIFLSRQNDYVNIRNDTQIISSELQRYRVSEEFLAQTIEEKEELFARTPRTSSRYARMRHELKLLKSNYVDTVHTVASLEERFTGNTKMMVEFEKKHRTDFIRHFGEASKIYREEILSILNAQSYLFDAEIWAQAKQSKVIKKFFRDAHIQGDYCAKTYLKYYLNTLDKEKLSVEQQQLFELYDYLESLEHDAAMILVSDVDDALQMKYVFGKMKLPVLFDAFVDSKKAMAWAVENRANLFIIADKLEQTSARQFVREYKKKVLLHPKIILLGEPDPQEAEQRLYDAVISSKASDGEIINTIKAVLTKEDDG